MLEGLVTVQTSLPAGLYIPADVRTVRGRLQSRCTPASIRAAQGNPGCVAIGAVSSLPLPSGRLPADWLYLFPRNDDVYNSGSHGGG